MSLMFVVFVVVFVVVFMVVLWVPVVLLVLVVVLAVLAVFLVVFLTPFLTLYPPSEGQHLQATFSRLVPTVLSSSLSKSVSIHISFSFQYLNDILDAAVNVEGGVTNIDRSLVIGLLGEIVVLLQIALKDLKVIVVADLTLNGVASSLRELAEIIINLLIVRILLHSLAFLFNLPFLVSLSSKSYCSFCHLVSPMSPSAASFPPLCMLFCS